MDDFFNIDGRLNRGTYLFHTLGVAVAIIIGVLIASYYLSDYDSLYIGAPSIAEEYALYIVAAALFLWMFPSIKRFHDFDMSGWTYIFCLIPIIAIIPNVMLLFRRGTRGPNQYGPDPIGHLNTSPENQAVPHPSDGVHFSKRSPAASLSMRTSGRQSLAIRSADLAAATVMLEEIKTHYQAELDQMREKHDQEINSLKSKCESAIDRANKNKAVSSDKQSKEIGYLLQRIADRNDDLKKAAQRIEALEKRLRLLGAIARFFLSIRRSVQRIFPFVGRAVKYCFAYMIKVFALFFQAVKPLSAKYACPHCKQHIEIERDLTGTKLDCPACNQPFTPGR